MTSKEALVSFIPVISLLKFTLSDSEKKERLLKGLTANIEIIKKDLEILEIIKSGLYNAEIINDWLCGVLSVKLNNEQKIIVKEWLEHETESLSQKRVL